MSSINRNNFLRWTGSMNETPFQNTALSSIGAMITGYEFVDIDILAGSTSTLGIDPNSIEVVQTIPTPSRPPRWNAQTRRLRVFRPATMPANQKVIVTFFFRDYLGNPSNTATSIADLSLSALSWRVNIASVRCLVNPYNVNTGQKFYDLLELYYPGTNALYLPLTTKANIIGDPDYVAPVTDTTACPLPSTAPLTIKNLTPAGSPTVNLDHVVWKKAPNPDIHFYPYLTSGGQSVIDFPTGIYDSLEIHFTHGAPITGQGFTFSYSPGQINTVSGALTDSNSPRTINNPVHAQPGSTISIQK